MSGPTDSLPPPFKWARPLLLLVAGMAALLAVGGTALADNPSGAADDGHDHEHHDHYHADHASVLDHSGRFTGPNGQWPPEPKGAHNADVLMVRGIDSNRDEVVAVKAALESAEVVAELGERYETSAAELRDLHDTIPSAKVHDDGKREQDEVVVVQFSYSENQTVRTTMKDGKVHDVETVAAADEQPPLTPADQDRAIEIAKAWWQAQGNSRVNDLEGYAIRAFQADGSYYPVRMVYVSFHETVDHAPELLTNVDMTNETVAKGWSE